MAPAEKVIIMVIKVDLQCPRCYRKIKKVLCKFPQIRDQLYDYKNNTVTITVVCCCSPEKIKQNICYRGGDSIKGIEIKEPPKPKPLEKPKEPEKPKPPEKPKEPELKKYENPKEPSQPLALPAPIPVLYPIGVCSTCRECYEGHHHGGPCFHGYGYGRPPPPPYYEGYGRPVYESWGGGYNRDYYYEENPLACTIM